MLFFSNSEGFEHLMEPTLYHEMKIERKFKKKFINVLSIFVLENLEHKEEFALEKVTLFV